MHIGLKIKKLRKSKYLSQEKLAEISGVSIRTLSRIELTGKGSGSSLLSITEALNTTMEELNKLETNGTNETFKEGLNKMEFLAHIVDGRELMRTISQAHQYGYDYNDCIHKDQKESAQDFIRLVADSLDILDELTIDQKLTLENDMTEQINNLNKLGLWVFGNNTTNNNWTTAIIEIYSKENPLIKKRKIKSNFIVKINPK